MKPFSRKHHMNSAHPSRSSVLKALLGLAVVALIAWQVPFSTFAEEGKIGDATAPLTVTCDADPSSPTTNQTVTWTAHASGGNSYFYAWSGDVPNQSGANAQSVSTTYAHGG